MELNSDQLTQQGNFAFHRKPGEKDMKVKPSQPVRAPLALGCFATLLVVLGGLIACDSNMETPTSVPVGAALSVLTIPPDPTPTASLPPALATDIAKNTQVVTYGYHIATVVALTHAPTWTPGIPVYPTPTLELGILGGCSNTNSFGFQCYNVWRGYRAGHLIEVLVGREGRDGDMTQGEIMIVTQNTYTFYPAPGKTGPLDIVSVDGDLLTVTAFRSPNHETFIFNLGTHEWATVSPVPGGSPSADPPP